MRETNKGPPILTNQAGEAMSRVTDSAMFFSRDMTIDFRGNGYSKNRLICDCDGEPTHAITALLAILAETYKG